MNGIAAEFAVEVLVHFQKRDGNALPGKKQGKHGAGGPAPNDAAGRLVNVPNSFVRGTGGGSGRSGHARFHLISRILASSRYGRKSGSTRNLTGNAWSCKNAA